MREIRGAANISARSEAGSLAGRQLSLSLGTKSSTELRRIVLENTHDQALLGVVHSVLSGRRNEEAANLRLEVEQLLKRKRLVARPAPNIPIWTRASDTPRGRRIGRWTYFLGFRL